MRMHATAATLLTSALLALPAGAGELLVDAKTEADSGPDAEASGGQTEPLTAASDWAGLDAEIQSFALSTETPDGPRLGTMIRMNGVFRNWPNGWDGGINYGDLEARLFGGLGDYDYRVSIDFKFGDVLLEDAYARTGVLNDSSSITVGRFKTPILRSASLGSNKLLFNDRSIIGRSFDFFDNGAMFQGGYGAAQFMLAAQSGLDGQAINYLYTGRFEYRFGGGVRNQAGARGGQKFWNWSTLRSTVGFMFLREESRIDGDAFGFDLALTSGYWYLHLEGMNLGEDLTQFETQDEGMRPFALQGDSSPWSIALSYMLHPDLVGLQGRWQRLDDDLGTSVLTVGMSWYQYGWNARFLFDVSQVKDSTGRSNFIQFGTAIYLD